MGMLSICIPAYNAERTLSKLVESIIKQDCEFLNEIIIVNDGSTDNTLSICEYLKFKYSKVHIINQNNKGAGGARNSAIRHVSSAYFSFIDSDDSISNDYIATILRETENIECDIYIFDYIKEQIGGKKFLIKGDEHSSALPSCVFSRSYWRKNEFKFIERSIYEDNAINYYIFHCTDKKTVINKVIYYYIQNKYSISVKKTTNMIYGRISSSKEFIKNKNKHNISISDEIYLSHIVKWYEIAISSCFYRIGTYKLIKEVITEFDRLDPNIAKMANKKTILIYHVISSMGKLGYYIISLTKLSKRFK